MARMNAAVVTSFAEPPHYQHFEVPRPGRADEALVDVLAVGLHPRVRSGAAGAHYTSTGTLPMIPGIDAVGQRPDGKRIYFVAADDVIGTMADQAVASPRRSIELTDDAEETGQALAAAAAESDIVLDYLWGQPAQQAMVALLTARSDRSRALNWIQIGAVAGATIELPSAALRSANFRLQGSGQGAVSAQAYLAELPSLVDEINKGTIAVTANTMPLAEVEQVWTRPDVPGERTVLVP
jgi:hypothetical protein